LSERAQAQAVVVGGGPAGLMAAEALLAAGLAVDLYEAAPSVGRKILIAGKGGLNLTHSEPKARFIERFRERSAEVGRWLTEFDADDLRRWAQGLGVETVVGSSGRVFPTDFKAAPLLRGWLRRLRAQGMRLHTRHRFSGWAPDGALRIEVQTEPPQELLLRPVVTVLALGGASWSKLGADGRWVAMLRAVGVEVADLAPANCGFECDWSEILRSRHAGAPVKQVTLRLAGPTDNDGSPALRGEFVLTDYGVEGSLVYALSAALREAIVRDGKASVWIDLCPDRTLAELRDRLAVERRGRSWSELLRRQIGLDGVRHALLRELAPASAWTSSDQLASQIKQLPLTLLRTRPIDEAISSAGGVRFAALDASGMLRQRPGVWCAGEMVDWEAPTGGYLLTACLASGLVCGRAAAAWAGQIGREFPAELPK
jgi:uncharacterized flavoprotein (TIGR03862 family)